MWIAVAADAAHTGLQPVTLAYHVSQTTVT